jgi:glycosyltransferase involved in cell wall biosynthesis
MNTKMRVSVVIPVYNEVDRIYDCLQAIDGQTVRPFEVLVVDNNSTDGSAVVAASFPFVRVLHEAKQGVVYARDKGFNTARGDIIARIDADTLVAADWIKRIEALFTNPAIDLISGSVQVREIGAPRLASRVDLFWRRRMQRKLGDRIGLQGANMALRRSVWQTIKQDVCHVSGLHEDFDIGVHAYEHGFKARFVEDLRVSVCHRQCNAGFRRFAEYALTSPRTYLRHGVKEGRVMYQVVAFVLLVYPIIYLLTHGYDERLGRFSFAKLFAPELPPRVNPATFID